MTNSTATVVIVLQSATLIATLGIMGAAIFVARRARREAKAARKKFDDLKAATARFATDINNIF